MTIDFSGTDPLQENLVIYKGSTFNPEYEWLQYDGSVYDFSGATIELIAKDSAGAIQETWNTGNTKASGSSLGIIAFNLTDEETAAMTWTDILTYCLWVEDTTGAKYLFQTGNMTLKDNC